MAVPGYRVLVLIGWRILWQAIGSFLILLFLANLALLSWLPELTRTGPSLWALLIPLLSVTVLVAFFIMPAVVRGLLTRSFGGFRLQAVHEGAPREASEPVPTKRRSGHETVHDGHDSGSDPRTQSYGSARGSSPRR